jgi:hypothetical protein
MDLSHCSAVPCDGVHIFRMMTLSSQFVSQLAEFCKPPLSIFCETHPPPGISHRSKPGA